jgi:O-antigen/teichoic acid export membrane protein
MSARSVRSSGVAAKAGVIVFSKAFAHLSRILAIVVLARLLAKTDFGALSFVLLTYIAVTGLAQIGLPESVYFFFEKLSRGSRGRFVLLVARLLFLLGLASSAVLIGIALVADRRGHDVLHLFVPLTLLPLLELPTFPVTHILIATDRAREAAWLNIAFSSALVAALAAPVLLGQPLVTVSWGLVAYGAFRLAACTVVFLRHFGRAMDALPAGTMRSVFDYSLPLGFAQLVWKLNQVVDKYVVMYFLPMAVFAEYSVGSWEIPLVPMVANAVAAVMMPQFVSAYLDGRREDLLSAWTEAVEKVSIIVLPLVVLFLVIARDLIVLLFTEKYLNAVLPFQIYTLILLQRVTAYDAVLKAIDRTRVVTLWALFTIAVNLVLCVPFVLWIGMAGAALSTLIANAVTWVYVLVKIGHGLGVKLKEVFPFRFYGRVLAAAILAAAAPVLLGAVTDFSAAAALAWKTLVYAGAFAFVSTGMGVCGRQEWDFVLGALRLKRKSPANE